jgi:hypothetical protein
MYINFSQAGKQEYIGYTVFSIIFLCLAVGHLLFCGLA